MADIVLGIGCSHSPLLTMAADDWRVRAESDKSNPALFRSSGKHVTYEELLSEADPRFVSACALDVLQGKERKATEAVDRLAHAIAAAAPDVAVIIGDDHGELYDPNNMPAVSVYLDERVMTYAKYKAEEALAWRKAMAVDYMMDDVHAIRCATAFGLELVSGLIDRNVDVSLTRKVDDPHRAGLGHAFGFIVKRILRELDVSVVPLLINTYYPPNVPSAARCFDIGAALAASIRDSGQPLRVAIIASGGLSHFVVDERLDRDLLGAIEREDVAYLRSVPREALLSGSSEILNWIAAAGALKGIPVTYSVYEPVVRTPAGTGVGLGFCIWEGVEPAASGIRSTPTPQS